MFLEGEINWTLVFGALAIAGGVAALVAIWIAIVVGQRQITASGQLDIVQKFAEAADRRLAETLNAVPVAMVETDRAGKFVFANRAAHQLLGRRDAELLGLRFHSATWGITFPDGKPVPPDLLPSARALRGQTVRGFQHLLVNVATRKKMLVSVTAMPIENAWGQVTGSMAAMVETDVLTTPAIEPAAPPLEPVGPNLSDRVFDAASSALVVVGPDGRVRQANRAALALLGRVDGVVEADFADLFIPEDRRVEGRQALRAALAAPAGEAEPLDMPGFGGEPLRWSMLPLPDEAGAVDVLLLAGAPVPAIVPAPQVEPPLADASETIVDAPPVGEIVMAASPEAGGDAVAAFEAEAVESDIGIAAAVETALAEARAAFVQREAEILAARDQALAEAAAATAEAARAEREARAELEASRRLESVGRLTGGVAQDFNALLGVMTSALDMMLRQADEPDRVRRLGQAALAAGQRGELLTRRLSAFSQGGDLSDGRVLDAGVLLRGLEGKLRALTGPQTDLLIETPSGPAEARFDAVGFDGAVQALVRNAVEASGEAGSVAVRLETLPEGGVRLSVRDSGPGLDADVARRALEPFFTTRPGAAGLGLAQAHAFARQSSGELRIDSAPGEGAEVSIVLPAAA